MLILVLFISIYFYLFFAVVVVVFTACHGNDDDVQVCKLHSTVWRGAVLLFADQWTDSRSCLLNYVVRDASSSTICLLCVMVSTISFLSRAVI